MSKVQTRPYGPYRRPQIEVSIVVASHNRARTFPKSSAASPRFCWCPRRRLSIGGEGKSHLRRGRFRRGERFSNFDRFELLASFSGKRFGRFYRIGESPRFWSQAVACQAHNLKVTGSNPVPRTAEVNGDKPPTAHYEEAKLSIRRQVDPHETPVSEMMKHVVRVISIEGPIHESEIVLRIRSAWGLARAGNRIRDAVQAAIKAAKRKGDIAGGPFYLVPGQAVVVRNRSDVESNTLRKPEILPPDEVRVAIAEVVEENYGAERDQLVQAVARLFGFGSTSAQLREVVETALTDLLDAGRLRLEGRLVTRGQPEATSV